MITVQETTVWDRDYENHRYILSDDKRWMYGFIRNGEKFPKLFNNPIGFDPARRTFRLIAQTKDISADKRVWHITGSKGDIYTVTRREERWSCTCPSAMFRGSICKHIDQVKQTVE